MSTGPEEDNRKSIPLEETPLAELAPPRPWEKPPPVAPDGRIYLIEPENWTIEVKEDWTTEYCYLKFPWQDHFHLFIKGEVYVMHGSMKLCLRCALRENVITTNRNHWQI